MTVVTGGPLLAKALDQAEENIAAGRWVVTAPLIGPGKEDVQEGRFTDRLHPRGRHGQFIDTGHHEALSPGHAAAMDSDIADILSGIDAGYDRIDQGDWTRLDGGEVGKRYTPPFSPAVAKLTGWRDTQDYLKGLGLPDTDLEPEPGTPSAHAGPDFYRSVAQAVTDATQRFPHLLGSPDRPLKGIRVMKETDGGLRYLRDSQGGDAILHVWGATSGVQEALTGSGLAQKDGKIVPGPQLISLNPHSDVYATNTNVYDFASPVTGAIYGRTMHELGHAVADSYGINDNGLVELLGNAEVSPMDIARFSPYGADSATEGWAEAFATLNVPHGLDDLGPGVADKLKALREQVNKHAQRSWGGALL